MTGGGDQLKNDAESIGRDIKTSTDELNQSIEQSAAADGPTAEKRAE